MWFLILMLLQLGDGQVHQHHYAHPSNLTVLATSEDIKGRLNDARRLLAFICTAGKMVLVLYCCCQMNLL